MNLKLLQAISLCAMFGGPPPVRRDTPVADEKEDFHGHLKRCPQCANQPFGLCVTGERLLVRDGTSAMIVAGTGMRCELCEELTTNAPMETRHGLVEGPVWCDSCKDEHTA